MTDSAFQNCQERKTKLKTYKMVMKTEPNPSKILKTKRLLTDRFTARGQPCDEGRRPPRRHRGGPRTQTFLSLFLTLKTLLSQQGTTHRTRKRRTRARVHVDPNPRAAAGARSPSGREGPGLPQPQPLAGWPSRLRRQRRYSRQNSLIIRLQLSDSHRDQLAGDVNLSSVFSSFKIMPSL